MRTDVDYIISLMKKFTDNGFKNEIGEQIDNSSDSDETYNMNNFTV